MTSEDVAAAMAAWEQGRAYERQERERRIAWMYALVGAAFLGIALVVVVSAFVGTTVAAAAAALTGLAYLYARRRLFRWLPTDESEVWGVSSWAVVALCIGGVGASVLADAWGREGTIPAIIVASYATLVAVQAANLRDRTHAVAAAILYAGAGALAFAGPALGRVAEATAPLAVGAALLVFAAVRFRRGRAVA